MQSLDEQQLPATQVLLPPIVQQMSSELAQAALGTVQSLVTHSPEVVLQMCPAPSAIVHCASVEHLPQVLGW